MIELMPAVYRYAKTRGVQINEYEEDGSSRVSFVNAKSGEVLLVYHWGPNGFTLLESNVGEDRELPLYLQDAPFWIPDTPAVQALLRYLHEELSKTS